MPAVPITSSEQYERAIEVLTRVGGTATGVGQKEHFLLVSPAQFQALVEAKVTTPNETENGSKHGKNSRKTTKHQELRNWDQINARRIELAEKGVLKKLTSAEAAEFDQPPDRTFSIWRPSILDRRSTWTSWIVSKPNSRRARNRMETANRHAVQLIRLPSAPTQARTSRIRKLQILQGLAPGRIYILLCVLPGPQGSWYPSGQVAFAVDHIKPKGKAAYAHLLCDYRNLVYACNRCNSAKTDRLLLDPCRGGLTANDT